MKLTIWIKLTLFSCLWLACNSSKISSSWKSPAFQTKNFQQIVIWAIVSENDSALKIKMENHFVNDLKEAGYNAIAAYTVYGFNNKLQEKEIVPLFKKSGVDGLITLVLLDKKKELNFYPPIISYQPVAESNFSYAGRYLTSTYEKVYTPGYYATDTRYFWECNLYDMSTEKLVYVLKTDSFNPQSTEKLAHENGKLILSNMLKTKIFSDAKANNK